MLTGVILCFSYIKPHIDSIKVQYVCNTSYVQMYLEEVA